MLKSILGTAVLIVVGGCIARPIDVGNGPDGSTGNTSSTLPPPPGGPDNPPLPNNWPDPNACVATSNLAIVGHWNGYQGRFQNPTPDFEVDIRGASATGGLCGTVVHKPGTPPPPPMMDPTIMYPPEDMGYPSSAYAPPRLSGFVYTILNGRAQGTANTRVSFALTSREPYRDWCEAQPAYPLEPGSSLAGCLPNWSYVGGGPYVSGCYMNSPDSHQVPVNCGRLYLCGIARACECNPARCVAGQSPDTVFDLTFAENEATGTATGQLTGDVLLVRKP